ncbi:hypothetical protein AVI51_01880 [Piscirickettsia salmonis]|uniref:Prevent-host-death protein n=1 Tax=Piscirickettsia salmonis TaxID=1238 RepID=A0A0K2DWS5_PISSA|nr:hypothetical protein [Piscirickettsia salmonis]RNC77479.1 hypothetical protein DA717_10030 [Piscirickettsiaceae bacterium NZ-RLO2]AKP74004.1 hypothetical protein PSLF89_2282 [Piscirickettsia salmonis LF-89 = ATCC VR-1361]ALA24805.1 prevent-host-death protein [Piscirickettsia salmonis]ALB22848.1 prevent-host-death protein [Piscirickettsia salmonis]ALY02827.1 hypothetical protein AWE47_08150 [Piscirickettsia salmonis]
MKSMKKHSKLEAEIAIEPADVIEMTMTELSTRRAEAMEAIESGKFIQIVKHKKPIGMLVPF